MVLWSLAKTALSLPIFNTAEHWNVHVLSMDQQALSNRFAARGEDKFKDLQLDQGITNAPLLSQCSARFQCKTAFIHDGGDHVIFIGEVLDFDQSNLPPLVFQSGQYALTARKPWQDVSLSQADAPLECSYTEDLLGYLLGRAHFQMLKGMQQELAKYDLTSSHFFALSVLAIRDGLTLAQINAHIDYTGQALTQGQLDQLIHANLLAYRESKTTDAEVFLTEQGRQASLGQIAQAKAIEDELIDELGRGMSRHLNCCSSASFIKLILACRICGQRIATNPTAKSKTPLEAVNRPRIQNKANPDSQGILLSRLTRRDNSPSHWHCSH